eukprot:4508153-Pyramimonas_sp.AAC.1
MRAASLTGRIVEARSVELPCASRGQNPIDISLVSPRMLQELLESGLQRQAELALGQELGFPPGFRATLDLVRDKM